MDIVKWFNRTTSGASENEAARKAGIPQRTLNRQLKAGALTPEIVAPIARAYGTDVLDALTITGLITDEDIARGSRSRALRTLTDEEIARAVWDRLAGDVDRPALTRPLGAELDNPDDIAAATERAHIRADAWNLLATLLSAVQVSGGTVALAEVQPGAGPSAWWEQETDTLYAALADDPWTARVVVAEALARRERARAQGITPTAYACARVAAGSGRDVDVARVLGVTPGDVQEFREAYPILAVGAQ
mgnify:CR=1 FL=1